MIVLDIIRARTNHAQRTVLLKSSVALLVRALGAFSGFLLSVAIARSLSPEDAGNYFLAFSLVSILSVLGMLGLPNSLLRFISSNTEENNLRHASSVFNKGFSWALIFSCIVAGLIWVSSPLLAKEVLRKPEIASVLKSMSPSIVFVALFTLNGRALQALGKVVKAVFTVNIGLPITMSIVLISGLAVDAKTAGYYFSMAALAMVLLSLGWWLQKPGIEWRNLHTFPSSTLWNSCYPLWIVAIMGQVVQWAGQLISGAYVASEEVALLAVAQRTSMLTSFILMAVNLVVAPKFAALYKQGKAAELQIIAIFATRLMVLFALPLVCFMLLFPELLMCLFGDAYTVGGNLLRILAIGQFISVVSGSVGFLLTMSGHERDLRNVVLFSGPLAIVLSLVLTPLYGVVGAAVATATSVASQNLLAVAMVRKRLGFNTLAIWRKN